MIEILTNLHVHLLLVFGSLHITSYKHFEMYHPPLPIECVIIRHIRKQKIKHLHYQKSNTKILKNTPKFVIFKKCLMFWFHDYLQTPLIQKIDETDQCYQLYQLLIESHVQRRQKMPLNKVRSHISPREIAQLLTIKKFALASSF